MLSMRLTHFGVVKVKTLGIKSDSTEILTSEDVLMREDTKMPHCHLNSKKAALTLAFLLDLSE